MPGIDSVPKDGFPMMIQCGCKAAAIEILAPPIWVGTCHCGDCKVADFVLDESAVRDVERNGLSEATKHVSGLVGGGASKCAHYRRFIRFKKDETLEVTTARKYDGDKSKQHHVICKSCYTRMFTFDPKFPWASVIFLNYNLFDGKYKQECRNNDAFVHYNFTKEGGHWAAALGFEEILPNTRYWTSKMYSGHVVGEDGIGFPLGSSAAALRGLCLPVPCWFCCNPACDKGRDKWWRGEGAKTDKECRGIEFPPEMDMMEQSPGGSSRRRRISWSQCTDHRTRVDMANQKAWAEAQLVEAPQAAMGSMTLSPKVKRSSSVDNLSVASGDGDFQESPTPTKGRKMFGDPEKTPQPKADNGPKFSEPDFRI